MIKSIFYHTIFPTDVRIPLLSQTKNAENVVANQKQIDTWMKQDILARYYLTATIETQQQRSLINCRTAHEMGTKFFVQYLQNAAEDQHALRQRFYDYKFQPEHDVMAHITTIETMVTHLNDAGATVDPIQVMTKIVCTLPRTFENFSLGIGQRTCK